MTVVNARDSLWDHVILTLSMVFIMGDNGAASIYQDIFTVVLSSDQVTL